MLRTFILPFVGILIARFQCANGQSSPNHLSIELFPGKFHADLLNEQRDPPKCSEYDSCGTIDWTHVTHIQFLQPENSQYPLFCSMITDNIKDVLDENPKNYFAVSKKYEAKSLKFMFFSNHVLKSHMTPYNLSIACSNGAHRCCLLDQKNAELKNLMTPVYEDSPKIIKPQTDADSSYSEVGDQNQTDSTNHPNIPSVAPGSYSQTGASQFITVITGTSPVKPLINNPAPTSPVDNGTAPPKPESTDITPPNPVVNRTAQSNPVANGTAQSTPPVNGTEQSNLVRNDTTQLDPVSESCARGPALPRAMSISFDTACTQTSTVSGPAQTTFQPCPNGACLIPPVVPAHDSQSASTRPNMNQNDDAAQKSAASRRRVWLSLWAAQHAKTQSFLPYGSLSAWLSLPTLLAALVFPYLFLLPSMGF